MARMTDIDRMDALIILRDNLMYIQWWMFDTEVEKEYQSIARTIDVVIEVVVQKIKVLENKLENLREGKENLVVVDFANKKVLK